MDFDSSTKFISSLAKFLQSLCNGYVEFDSGVEVIGHIYLSVDTGKKIDYILNEKVCKTDENSVTFISNSFHAQPAEKPKPPPPPPPPPKTDATIPEKEEKVVDDDDIILMDEPESTNVGTIPMRDNSHHQNNAPPSNFNNTSGASKRPHNQHFPPNRPSKHRRKDSSSSNPHGAPSNSHESHDSSFSLPSEMSTVTPASEADLSHLSQALADNNSSHLEERDVKPVLDSDMNVVNVKQEYDPSAESQDSSNMYNEQQDEGGYYSGMAPHDQSYDMGGSQYYGGRRGNVHSEYDEMGSSDMYQGGAGPGDSSGSMMAGSQGQAYNSTKKCKEAKKYRYECELCGRKLFHKKHYEQHKNAVHYKTFPYSCPNCSKQFAYRESYLRHLKHTCKSLPRS